MTAQWTDVGRLKRTIAELLDRVLVRRENGYEVQQRLKVLASEGAVSQSEEVATLLAKAQGTVGMVNASSPGDPLYETALRDLRTFKQQLRS